MDSYASNRAGFVASNPTLLSPVSSSGACVTLRKTLPTVASVLAVSPAVQIKSSASALSTQLSPKINHSSFFCPPNAAGASGTAIVLFRSDLRLDDHPALTQAIETASTIIPVFCFDPRHFGRTEHGFDRTGKYRARFLIESVQNLRERLQAIGSNLIVRLGKPEDVIPDLATLVGASHVFLHREVTYEEQTVEDELEKLLKHRGIETNILWASTLYHCDDMPFHLVDMPDVYSDFREGIEKVGKIRAPLKAPTELPALPNHIKIGEMPDLAALGISDLTTSNAFQSYSMCAVKGGEDEALRLVEAYVKDSRKLELYSSKTGKEAAHIGADFSCRISPWLALGCLSPRRIFEEMSLSSLAPKALLRSSTYLELVWRDFFICITAKYSEKHAAAVGRKARRLTPTSCV